MKNKRWLLWTFFVVLLALALVGCGGGSSGSKTLCKDGALVNSADACSSHGGVSNIGGSLGGG